LSGVVLPVGGRATKQDQDEVREEEDDDNDDDLR